ncbi:MAG: hypothetical protein PVF68_08095, partial [Acidobacteriota bacterium]
MKRNVIRPALLASCLLLPGRPPGAAPGDLDAGARKAIVERVATVLQRSYVFEETAEEIARTLQANLAGGDYDGIATTEGFADRLTADMAAVA